MKFPPYYASRHGLLAWRKKSKKLLTFDLLGILFFTVHNSRDGYAGRHAICYILLLRLSSSIKRLGFRVDGPEMYF